MAYFTQSDLENALSKSVVKGVYDDDRDGTVDAGPIAACIAYGTAQCNSFLRKVMTTSGGERITLPLTTIPDEVKFAALDFGIAYTIRRRPDVVKAMNEQPWTVFFEQACEQMKRYVASQQVMPIDTVGHTSTEGGGVFPIDPEDDECAVPRWSDPADFA